MIYCTRRYDPVKGGVVITAMVEVEPVGSGRFRCYDVFVSDERVLENSVDVNGRNVLERAAIFATAKLQEALDADRTRDQPR